MWPMDHQLPADHCVTVKCQKKALILDTGKQTTTKRPSKMEVGASEKMTFNH